MQWAFLSAITAIAFSIAYITTAFVSHNNTVNEVAWTTTVHLIGVILIVILVALRLPRALTDGVFSHSLQILSTPIPLIISIVLGLSMFANEVCLFNSIKTAPNPGLPTTVSNLYIIVVVLLSYIFYALPVSTKQGIGILLALFSLYLVSG